MGLQVLGNTQEWNKLQEYHKHIREHGIQQFLNVYNRFKDRVDETFLWGDEIEMLILRQDPDNKKVYLAQRGNEQIENLRTTLENPVSKGLTKYVSAIYHQEYANYMIEATPGVPYGDYTSDLRLVQLNMVLRRRLIQLHLHQDEIIVTSPIFPLLGVQDIPNYSCIEVKEKLHGPISNSSYVSDDIISPHPRFGSLTLNIRARRGRNVDIRVPLYKDVHTDTTKTYIHGDAMGFGMGLCCLQVTFQTRSYQEARFQYDQLAIISPLFLALTANTPFFRGSIASCDVRWNIISACVDDRRDDEIVDEQEQVQSSDRNRIEDGEDVGVGVKYPYGPQLQSRYSCIDCYLGGNNFYKDIYNDIPFRYDVDLYNRLLQNDVDVLVGKHVASQFVRDPLVGFDERIQQDDTESTEHFESQQTTNWRSVRFKPPPSLNSSIGWRVEFRTMEIQMTDFENAAFTVFITLLARAILYFNLNFYIPLSKVYKNFQQAHIQDPISNGCFYMRNVVTKCVPKISIPDEKVPTNQYCNNSNPFFWELKEQIKVLQVPCCAIRSQPCPFSPDCPQSEGSTPCHSTTSNEPISGQYSEMTMEEVFCGKAPHYPGLIPLIRSYLDHIKCDRDTRDIIDKYITLIEQRIKKVQMTGAEWQRRFVLTHPTYKKDSKLTTDMVYDLSCIITDAANGFINIPEMVGTLSQQVNEKYSKIHNQGENNVANRLFQVQQPKLVYSNCDQNTKSRDECQSFDKCGLHNQALQDNIIKDISVIESQCHCRNESSASQSFNNKLSYDAIAQLTDMLATDSSGTRLLGSQLRKA